MKFLLVLLLSCVLGYVNTKYYHKNPNLFITDFRDIYRIPRNYIAQLLTPNDIQGNYLINTFRNTVQRPSNRKYFCDVNGPGRRSVRRPESVHYVRPGDIDVVAAMGDSISAANGAMAYTGLHTFIEDRSFSFSGGGYGKWNVFGTLPNLIKSYNPNVYGYSVSRRGSAFRYEPESKLNVAEPRGIVKDAPMQARLLVQRMNADRAVDVQHDWKIVTIFLGSNDFCFDTCYRRSQDLAIENARQNIMNGLRILRDNLPRTLVNLVYPLDVLIIYDMINRPLSCRLSHLWECPCAASATIDNQNILRNTIMRWKEMMDEVTHTAEFHTNDFEVNIIKFTNFINITTPQGTTDYTLLSTDCFHLSQKGHQSMAINLWNQMLTPELERSNEMDVFDPQIKCPTYENPFFRTWLNS